MLHLGAFNFLVAGLCFAGMLNSLRCDNAKGAIIQLLLVMLNIGCGIFNFSFVI